MLVILVPGLIGDDFNGIEFYPLVPNNYETTWYAVIYHIQLVFVLSTFLRTHLSHHKRIQLQGL